MEFIWKGDDQDGKETKAQAWREITHQGHGDEEVEMLKYRDFTKEEMDKNGQRRKS